MKKILKTLLSITLFVTFTNDAVCASSGNRRAGVTSAKDVTLNLSNAIKTMLDQHSEVFQKKNVGFVKSELTILTSPKAKAEYKKLSDQLTKATINVCKLILKKCGYDSQTVDEWQDADFTNYLNKYFKKHERDYIRVMVVKDATVKNLDPKSKKGSFLKMQADRFTVIQSFNNMKVKIHTNAIGGSGIARTLNTMKGIDGTSRIEIKISIQDDMTIPEE